MKSITAFAVVLCAAAFFLSNVAAVPVLDAVEAEALEGVSNVNDVAVEDAVALGENHAASRQKRATCDLLSGTGVNHAACAAHCILRGNRGGYCNGQAVCVCRN